MGEVESNRPGQMTAGIVERYGPREAVLRSVVDGGHGRVKAIGMKGEAMEVGEGGAEREMRRARVGAEAKDQRPGARFIALLETLQGHWPRCSEGSRTFNRLRRLAVKIDNRFECILPIRPPTSPIDCTTIRVRIASESRTVGRSVGKTNEPAAERTPEDFAVRPPRRSGVAPGRDVRRAETTPYSHIVS